MTHTSTCPYCNKHTQMVRSEPLTTEEAVSIHLPDIHYFHVCTNCNSVLTDNGIELKHTHDIKDMNIAHFAFLKFPHYANGHSEIKLHVSPKELLIDSPASRTEQTTKESLNFIQRFWSTLRRFFT